MALTSFLKSNQAAYPFLKSIAWLILLATVSLPLKAETIKVSIAASVAQSLPQATQRIMRAMDNTGYEVILTVLPNKRSLSTLRAGENALEFFRTPSVTVNFPELIRLEPVLQTLNFNMITSIQTPENCQATEAEYGKLSIAGVLGIGLHQIDLYPKFKNATSVNDVPTALRFVALRRADVTFFPNAILGLFPPEVLRELIVCPANFQPFSFYAHLHQDFAWAREKIEAALAAEFSPVRKITASD